MYNPYKGYTFTVAKGWGVCGAEVDEIVEVKSTFKIQLCSLVEFAAQLGYAFTGHNFIKVCCASTNTVKLNTMVFLHNTNCLGRFCFDKYNTRVGRTCDKFGFTPEDVKRAVNAKLVHLVYIQYGRKCGMKVQSHVIKFAD